MKFVDEPITYKLEVFVFIDFASFFISFVSHWKKKNIVSDLKDLQINPKMIEIKPECLIYLVSHCHRIKSDILSCPQGQ